MIELKNVCYVREGKTLLDSINWKIQSGKNWVLFGRNGSGKTLLLNLIEGYIHPTTGSINRFGQASGMDLREMRKHTGYVGDFIKRSVKPHHTVLNTILSGKFATVGLYDQYTPADKEKAEYWMESLEFSYLSGRKMRHLSEGERMRVLIARSLMADPKLLILDEPCSGLDMTSREEFLSILGKIDQQYPKAHSGQESLSILFVTHHVDEIIPIFSNILILKKGKVFHAGKVINALNDDIISQALDMPMKINKEYGRYWAIPRML